MRRLTVVFAVMVLLASVLGSAAPAWAKDGKRRHERRDRIEHRRGQIEHRRGAFSEDGRGRSMGGARRDFIPDRRDEFRGGFDGRWRDRPDGRWRDRSDWQWRDRFPGHRPPPFYGHRPGYFIVIPRDIVVFYLGWFIVLHPVYYDDVVLLPHRRYRVIERDLDSFLIIFDTGNLTIVLRG